MNGSYYPNPTFPGSVDPSQQQINNSSEQSNAINDGEMSYIENILRLNKGKLVTVFTSFPDSNEWRDRKFEGVIEEAGRDHLIISTSENGNWYLIPMIYLNYFDFKEKINYSHIYSEKNF